MDDILESYRVLDIGPNASLEEVKRAYRELARVWHPDRFPNDVRLQQKAQEKLKQINLAYERICGRGTHEPRRPTTSTTRPTAQKTQQSRPRPQSPPQPQTSQSESSEPKRTSWFWGPAGQPRYWWLIYVALVIAAVVFVSPYLATLFAIRRPQSVSPQKHDIFDEVVPSRASVTPPWVAFQPPSWALVSPTPIEIRRAEPVNEVGVSPTPMEIRRAEPVSEFRRQSPYFTIGSTKNDVLRIQGTPDSFSDEMFRYGGSTIRFNGDRVVSWYNGYPKMKAQLLPRPGTNAPAFFTVGSSRDEVLAVQGTPDSFSDEMFRYGGSTIRFKGDRVVSWYNGYPKMEARLLPRAGTHTPQFFTVGSSKDEVLAVQGTPDSFSDEMFRYGGSTVRFKGDRVVSWYNGYPRLNAVLRPSSP